MISGFIKNLIFFFAFVFSSQLVGQTDSITAKKDFSLAVALYKSGNYNLSIEKLSLSSIVFFKNAQWPQYLKCQKLIAQNHISLGDYDKALTFASDAIKISSQKLKTTTVETGELHNILGFVNLNKGRDDQALADFEIALDIFNKNLPAQNLFSAECFVNMGLLYYSRSNQQLALEYENKALNIRKKLLGENAEETADSYNDMGLVNSESKPEEALKYYQSALGIYKKIYKEDNQKIANVINNIAFIYLADKEFEKASEGLKEVLEIRKKIFTDRHPNVAFVYSAMGRVYEEENKLSEAMEQQLKALEIYQNNYGKKHFQIAATFNFIGNIYRKQKKYKEALLNYQQALAANHPDFENSNIYSNPPVAKYYKAFILLNSLLNKAHTLGDLYSEKTLKKRELELALSTLKSCDTLINIVRNVSINKSDKLALGAVASQVYEEGIRISLLLSEVSVKKNQYLRQAFYFSERGKAAVLLSSISDARAKKFSGIPDSILNIEKQLNADISFYEQKLSEGEDKNEDELRNKIFALHRNYDGLTKKLEKDFPKYFSLKYDVKVVEVDGLQNIIDDKTSILSYFIADMGKRVYIFYISKKSFKVIDVPKNENFDRFIAGLNNSIKSDVKSIFINSSFQLHKQLLFELKNKKIKNLVVIPDGKLGQVPFEVLINKKTPLDYQFLPYLIKRYSVSYDYSATLFFQKNNSPKASKKANSLLAMAPVSFNGNLNDLPGTKEEVEEIGSLIKGNNGKADVVLNEKATKDFLQKGKLLKYNLFHFATHGVVNEENPDLSQIYFSSGNKKEGPESLYAGDIYNLEIDADLVTLSACQTALGKIFKGEGIIGLSRAWVFAGGKNILVSLWSVNDNSTASLMKDFFSSYLLENNAGNFGKALQKAKTNMINGSIYSKPYNWAPFILIGK